MNKRRELVHLAKGVGMLMAGSIQKVGKKYRVTLELGFDANGKRMRKYQTVTTEKEAKKYLTILITINNVICWFTRRKYLWSNSSSIG